MCPTGHIHIDSTCVEMFKREHRPQTPSGVLQIMIAPLLSGDYPFSEKLSKLLLVNDSVEWFKKQPALFSHVLTVNKCNDISSTKSKTKVSPNLHTPWPLTCPSHTPHTALTQPSHPSHTLTHPSHTPHTPLTHPSHTLTHPSHIPHTSLTHSPLQAT